MAKKEHRFTAAARLWFAVTPQERKLLFGILAITLIGLTARHLHQRAQTPEELEPPDGAAVYTYEESEP
ncbi:MAG TPA: hypothetical protein PKE12_16005 [Kiritimatiellia bacterium]|nr:hypothetical protein [Kiritimatiellia bacterium]